MSGAAVYACATRGRASNILHVVAENLADARAQFIDAMERDHADRGLTDATARAAEAVRGLVADGPVKLVNDETGLGSCVKRNVRRHGRGCGNGSRSVSANNAVPTKRRMSRASR